MVGRHFFDDIGGLFGLQRFENARLNVGIHFGQRVGGHFAVDVFEDRLAILRAQVLDDIGEVSRMHVLQQAVRNVQTQAPLRIGLQNIAEFPADRMRGNAGLQPADPARRQNALEQAPEDAPDSDVDLQNP